MTDQFPSKFINRTHSIIAVKNRNPLFLVDLSLKSLSANQNKKGEIGHINALLHQTQLFFCYPKTTVHWIRTSF